MAASSPRGPAGAVFALLAVSVAIAAVVCEEATGPRGNATSNATLGEGNHTGSNWMDSLEEDSERGAIAVGRTAWALATAFLGAAMANSAGVGGGAVFVPIFNIVLGEDLKHSTATSQVMVTAGALVGVALNWNSRNPLRPERKLIESDFVLLLMPAMLLGISWGVLFNVAIQIWLQKVLMVTLYIYLAHVTISKGIKIFKKELQARKDKGESLSPEFGYEAVSADEGSESPGAVLTGLAPANAAQEQAQQSGLNRIVCNTGVRIQGFPMAPMSAGEIPMRCWMNGISKASSCIRRFGGAQEELDGRRRDSKGWFSFLQARSRPDACPVEVLKPERMGATTLVLLVSLWVLYFSFSLMHHVRPFCVRCSPSFWVMYAASAVVTMGFTVGILSHLHRKYRKVSTVLSGGLQEPLTGGHDVREEATGGHEPGDIDWSLRNLIRCTVVMLVAGVVAGFMGIGGGMIMSPLLLTLNVHPQVTAATSSMMVLFSSSSAFAQLALEGLIDPWQAVSFGFLAMVASATGITVVRRFIDKYGTTSIIILVLGIFIAGAAIVILVSGVVEFELIDRSSLQLFKNICSSGIDMQSSCLN